jgi:hypothetical protein
MNIVPSSDSIGDINAYGSRRGRLRAYWWGRGGEVGLGKCASAHFYQRRRWGGVGGWVGDQVA